MARLGEVRSGPRQSLTILGKVKRRLVNVLQGVKIHSNIFILSRMDAETFPLLLGSGFSYCFLVLDTKVSTWASSASSEMVNAFILAVKESCRAATSPGTRQDKERAEVSHVERLCGDEFSRIESSRLTRSLVLGAQGGCLSPLESLGCVQSLLHRRLAALASRRGDFSRGRRPYPFLLESKDLRTRWRGWTRR